MLNPLSEYQDLPGFNAISPVHIEPAIDRLIQQSRKMLAVPQQPVAIEPESAREEAASKSGPAAHAQHLWRTLIAPVEACNDQLKQVWQSVSHINAVAHNGEMRQAYHNGLLKLTEWCTELSQHPGLHAAYQKLAQPEVYVHLDESQRGAVDHALRQFRLSGIALPAEQRNQVANLQKRLALLSSEFANNAMDATQHWYKHVSRQDLAGLPESALNNARQAAHARGLRGFVITLDRPCYEAVMTHADKRQLRIEMYRAYTTRASDRGPGLRRWDNTGLINDIMRLRHLMANLLGFRNYAEYALQSRMAASPAEVTNFLYDLADKVLPLARHEMATLCNYANSKHGVEYLQPWDIEYYSEKLRQSEYDVCEQELREYFPVDQVVSGMFKVAHRLFGLEVTEQPCTDCWNRDVRFFKVSRNGDPIGNFYLDLFVRDNKQGGAWMSECRSRYQGPDGLQLPVAYIICNFMPPTTDTPSLLSPEEVTTLFHEFGHGLHHLLTRVDVPSVAGLNGVPRDAVELPSQLLENWCWQPDVIPMISRHYRTGEPLPSALLGKMLAARNFQSAMKLAKQLELAMFDFRLHREYFPAKPTDPQLLLDHVRQQMAVAMPPSFNRMQHSFSHIFADNYACGYYSYLWAKVLSADAFALFEEHGIFNREISDKFLHHILERGGCGDMMSMYIRFRGRKPNADALLRHKGLG